MINMHFITADKMPSKSILNLRNIKINKCSVKNVEPAEEYDTHIILMKIA